MSDGTHWELVYGLVCGAGEFVMAEGSGTANALAQQTRSNGNSFIFCEYLVEWNVKNFRCWKAGHVPNAEGAESGNVKNGPLLPLWNFKSGRHPKSRLHALPTLDCAQWENSFAAMQSGSPPFFPASNDLRVNNSPDCQPALRSIRL